MKPKHNRATELLHLLHCPVMLQSKFIQLHTRECLYNVRLSEILYCHSDNSLTIFHTASAQDIMVSKPLRHYENILMQYGFVRIHNKRLVNLAHVSECCHGEDGYIVKLTDKGEIGVSRAMRKNLIDALAKISVNETAVL